MAFTVLGGNGFIGSRLVERLRADGYACFVPPRSLAGVFDRFLGHVVDCIGLTADFRRRPFDTVEAHTSLVGRLLKEAHFDSFLYLSSARVYQKSDDGRETTPLVLDAADPSDLYNLSKLTGESLCLAMDRPEIRVVRPTNVFGHDPGSENFLTALLHEALGTGSIRLRTHPESAKDYVAVEDVVALLPRIALGGRYRLYNLGSGERTTNRAIVEHIAERTGCTLEMPAEAPRVVFPPISIERAREEFDFHPRCLLDVMDNLITTYSQGVIQP